MRSSVWVCVRCGRQRCKCTPTQLREVRGPVSGITATAAERRLREWLKQDDIQHVAKSKVTAMRAVFEELDILRARTMDPSEVVEEPTKDSFGAPVLSANWTLPERLAAASFLTNSLAAVVSPDVLSHPHYVALQYVCVAPAETLETGGVRKRIEEYAKRKGTDHGVSGQ